MNTKINHVEAILLENIDKPGTLFIFPTDVAVSRWADRLLKLRLQNSPEGIAAGGTIAMEKFIAWDKFKQNSIRSKVQDKTAIPTELRKMFTTALIRENSDLWARGETPVFSSIINREYAQQADSFTGWLTGILPQLGLWLRHTDQNTAAASAKPRSSSLTGDEHDLHILALRYAQFLEKYNLFEPAWEMPPFDDRGNKCFLFFPESLLDFGEYREILEAGENVIIVNAEIDSSIPQCDVFYYTNSRSEIAEAALYILTLHRNRNVPWDSISVSIPETGSYGPYLMREFKNRGIPCVNRTGKPISSYPAGQFFRAIAGCVSADYSLTSLTTLLLNRHLPWQNPELIQELIDFGIKNNCVCSWTEENDGKEKRIDVWKEAFARPLVGYNPEIRKFFNDLILRLKAIYHAGSFAEIRKNYFIFRSEFFNMERILGETDTILSRCISELTILVDLEKSYPDVKTPDPYMFFAGCLDERIYVAQQSSSGVTILPYRTAAPAPFDCHMVLGSSQENLSIIFSPLEFLSKGRRTEIGMTDNDVSKAYISLHRYNSRLPAAFFCSAHTFSGYTIPFNLLDTEGDPKQRYGNEPLIQEKFFKDLYREESAFYTSMYYPEERQIPLLLPGLIHQNQKQGFSEWQNRKIFSSGTKNIKSQLGPLPELIKKRYCPEELEGKIKISQSSLKPYFLCPLIWIFERLLNLENTETESELIPVTITGTVYHAILNLFFTGLIKAGGIIETPVTDSGGLPALPDFYQNLLVKNIEEVFESFPYLPGGKKPEMSMMTARLLNAEKNAFQRQTAELLIVFITYFAGYRVRASESSYLAERDYGFLNGTVDCILEDIRDDSPGYGTAIIVDFKTKSKFKLSDYTGEKGLNDFQLPMYIRLAEDTLKKDVHTALFFSILDTSPRVLFGFLQNIDNGRIIPEKENKRIPHGSETYLKIMNEFDKKTEQFARETTEGSFSFRPDNPQQCIKCIHNKVCRTMYRVCQEKKYEN